MNIKRDSKNKEESDMNKKKKIFFVPNPNPDQCIELGVTDSKSRKKINKTEEREKGTYFSPKAEEQKNKILESMRKNTR